MYEFGDVVYVNGRSFVVLAYDRGVATLRDDEHNTFRRRM